MWVLLWNFSRYRNEAFQWVDGRRSHRTSHVSNWNVSQWPAFPWNVTKGMQIMENPVSRRRPCQKRQLVDVIGDQGDGCPKQHTKEGIWAVLKRTFILQGRKELLMPPLRHHLCGHSASLRMGIPVFCLRASLRWLTHLQVLLTCTFLWPPPFLPHFFAGSPKVWW